MSDEQDQQIARAIERLRKLREGRRPGRAPTVMALTTSEPASPPVRPMPTDPVATSSPAKLPPNVSPVGVDTGHCTACGMAVPVVVWSALVAEPPCPPRHFHHRQAHPWLERHLHLSCQRCCPPWCNRLRRRPLRPSQSPKPRQLHHQPHPPTLRFDACADHQSDATIDTDDCTNCEPDSTSAQCRRRHADVPGLRNAHGSRDRCVPPV